MVNLYAMYECRSFASAQDDRENSQDDKGETQDDSPLSF